MRVLYWIAAGLVAVLMALVVMGLSSTKADDNRAESVVKVMPGNSHGSGVHIGNGYVITAAHVVEDAKTVTLKSTVGDIQKADVLWVNKAYDVALLKASRPERLGSSELACVMPPVGTSIMSIGNPVDVEFTRHWGRVAGGERSIGPWGSLLVTDITTVPGQSGGPVMNDDGEVVGITVGVMMVPMGFAGASYVGVGFIVPGKTICNLLARGA